MDQTNRTAWLDKVDAATTPDELVQLWADLPRESALMARFYERGAEVGAFTPLSPERRADLIASGIRDTWMVPWLVQDWGKRGWKLYWHDGIDDFWLPVYDRHERPTEIRDGKTREMKCAWPRGQTLILNRLHRVEGNKVSLVVEGVRQQLAATSWADESINVYGMNGCNGVHKGIADRLGEFKGQDVVIWLDKDRESKEDVKAAAIRGAKLFRDAGAASVRLIKIPDELVEADNDGADDILARKPEDERLDLISDLIKNAVKPEDAQSDERRVQVKAASEIQMRATRWLWRERDAKWIPLGGLILLAGREGIGKSTLAYRIAAQVTKGTLPGDLYDKPRGVIISASEDAWEETVRPRLEACGADLDKVFRVDAVTPEGLPETVMLPEDMAGVERAIREKDAALLLLDPLMGSISGTLDSHRDHSVRIALTPLSRLAAECKISIVGLIHENKSEAADILNRIMASRAFAAVARGVLYCAREDAQTSTEEGEPIQDGDANPFEKSSRFLFGQPKNNLAREVPWTLRYYIDEIKVGYDEEEDLPITGSRVVWHSKLNRSIRDIISEQESRGKTNRETHIDRAIVWLRAYLTEHGPTPFKIIKEAGDLKEHSARMLQRAADRIGVKIEPIPGTRNQTLWALPDVTVVNSATGTTVATVVTSPNGQKSEVTTVATVTQMGESCRDSSESVVTSLPDPFAIVEAHRAEVEAASDRAIASNSVTVLAEHGLIVLSDTRARQEVAQLNAAGIPEDQRPIGAMIERKDGRFAVAVAVPSELLPEVVPLEEWTV